MIKTIISAAVVALILVDTAILDVNFINGEFKDFSDSVAIVYEKVEQQNASEDDIYELQDKWLQSKNKWHAFIPHNEIKEFDLWIAEAIKLVKEEMWEDALSKLEVIKELAEQVPKTFEVSFSNIF